MKQFGVIFAACALASASGAAAGQADTWSGRGLRAESQDVIPPDFRGRITYSGSYEAEVTSNRGRTRPFSGAYTIEISYDGSAISGRYSGTGGMSSGSITGTRSGTRCRTLDTQSGMTNEAECTRTRFAVVARAQGPRNTSIARVEATATRFVDAAVEAQQQRVAAAEAAERRRVQEAQAQREAAAEARRIAALPRASATHARLLAAAIEQDSQSWALDRYVRGSLNNVRIWGSGGGETVVRGDFTYVDGRQGWIRGRIAGGQVLAIQYQNTFGYAAVRVPGANYGGSGVEPRGTCIRGRDPNGAPITGPC